MPATSEKVLSELGSELDGELAPIVSSLKDEASMWKITEFEKTPPMSSYLVAWANGQFEFVEDSVKLRERTIPLRIYGMHFHDIERASTHWNSYQGLHSPSEVCSPSEEGCAAHL